MAARADPARLDGWFEEILGRFCDRWICEMRTIGYCYRAANEAVPLGRQRDWILQVAGNGRQTIEGVRTGREGICTLVYREKKKACSQLLFHPLAR
jgi:hypothetical protein